MDNTQGKSIANLAHEIDDYLLAREEEYRTQAKGGNANTDPLHSIARARSALVEWAATKYASELESCSRIRETFFNMFLESRARSRTARVLSEQWLECEESAFFFLELSKIPTRFLSPEKIQELASQEHMQMDKATVGHKGH